MLRREPEVTVAVPMVGSAVGSWVGAAVGCAVELPFIRRYWLIT